MSFMRFGIFCACHFHSVQKRRTNHPSDLRALGSREAPFAEEFFRTGLILKLVPFQSEALKLSFGVNSHGSGFPDGNAVFANAEVAVGKAAVRKREVPALLGQRKPPKRECGEGRKNVALRHPLGLVNLRKLFSDLCRNPEKNRNAQLMMKSP